jgi:hypothetical protein
VTSGDVDRVIDAARAVAIPADQRILHILPQEFIIDHQEGIKEPIGMSGVRLESKVHIVTGADSAAQNIIKCVQRCGLAVDDIVLRAAVRDRARRDRHRPGHATGIGLPDLRTTAPLRRQLRVHRSAGPLGARAQMVCELTVIPSFATLSRARRR